MIAPVLFGWMPGKSYGCALESQQPIDGGIGGLLGAATTSMLGGNIIL
jgi:hypothetical protein